MQTHICILFTFTLLKNDEMFIKFMREHWWWKKREKRIFDLIWFEFSTGRVQTRPTGMASTYIQANYEQWQQSDVFVVVVFLVWFIRVFSFSSSFIGVVVISAVVTVVSSPFFDYHCRSRCHLRRLCLALDVLTRTMVTKIRWMSFVYHTCKYVVCWRARFPCRPFSRMERNNIIIFDCKNMRYAARKIWHDLLLCHIHWFKVNALISVNKKFSIQKATLADWVYFIAAMGDIDGNNHSALPCYKVQNSDACWWQLPYDIVEHLIMIRIRSRFKAF